jgi:hypothetical protein
MHDGGVVVKWKKRKAELARLRKAHPVVSVNSLPDLSSDRTRLPSLTSTGVSTICDRATGASPAKLSGEFFVGTPHKQGPMVMLRSELPWGGGKKS